jgi:hypothetical protein
MNWCRWFSALRTTNVTAIIYDFEDIGGALRKQRIDDWWQPAKPERAPQAARPITNHDWYDPFGRLVGKAGAMSGEAALLALMRADRLVQNRRKAHQAAVDLEATNSSAAGRVRAGRTRQTTRSTKHFKVGAAGRYPDRLQGPWCYPASALFHVRLIPGCPRDLGRLPVVSPNPVRDKWSGC